MITQDIIKLLSIFKNDKSLIDKWFKENSNSTKLIPYCSIDIRNSGFKIAPVDINLFPAGFNNISITSKEEASKEFKNFFFQREKILLIIENHDRNLHYLQNALDIKKILEKSGKQVEIANFVNRELNKVLLPDNQIIEIDGIKIEYSDITTSKKLLTSTTNFQPDIILLNNDLSDGYPEILKNAEQKIFPNPNLGWFKRKKSLSFEIYSNITKKFCDTFQIDPWLLTPISSNLDNIDFKNEDDLQKIYTELKRIFNQIQQKYDQYKIDSKPYCFIKSNSGTYGMGIIVIENPDDIFTLNKKSRKDMDKGKSGIKIDSILIQEGIPSIEQFEGATSEKTIYLVNGKTIGGFYRYNKEKNEKTNLNSQGAMFKPLEKDEYSSPLAEIIARLVNLTIIKETEFYTQNIINITPDIVDFCHLAKSNITKSNES